MKTCIWLARILLSVFIVFACTNTKKTGQSAKPKISVLPVYLSIIGIDRDTSIRGIFEEAFSKHKALLISEEEMNLRNGREVRRSASKVFTKDSKFDNTEDMIKAIGREHRYISNNLTITLDLLEKVDSLMINKVSWSNTPFPPNFSQINISKPKEIKPQNFPFSLRENIFSIVDSILYSKELK